MSMKYRINGSGLQFCPIGVVAVIHLPIFELSVIMISCRPVHSLCTGEALGAQLLEE